MAAKPKAKPKAAPKRKVTKRKKPELNLKQKLFCELFASEKEFFGNGTQAYIEAYNISTSRPGAYDAARVSAHDLLTNPNILQEINRILESAVLNDAFVDKQLAFLIAQNADFKTKATAIKEYNALKSRVTKKLHVESEVTNPFAGLTAEELRKIAEKA